MTSAMFMPLGQRTLQVMHEAQIKREFDFNNSSFKPS
jgi:energy-coupling factor transporter transmembrane protein EcfT